MEQVSYCSAPPPPPHTNLLWRPGSRPDTLTPANVANEEIEKSECIGFNISLCLFCIYNLTIIFEILFWNVINLYEIRTYAAHFIIANVLISMWLFQILSTGGSVTLQIATDSNCFGCCVSAWCESHISRRVPRFVFLFYLLEFCFLGGGTAFFLVFHTGFTSKGLLRICKFPLNIMLTQCAAENIRIFFPGRLLQHAFIDWEEEGREYLWSYRHVVPHISNLVGLFRGIEVLFSPQIRIMASSMLIDSVFLG